MRKPMVTRTFKGMEVTAMCVDTKTAEVTNETFTLSRAIKDKAKLFETATLKVVDIVDTKLVDTMYGMTEQDFIKYATILDPETRKAVESETENEAE